MDPKAKYPKDLDYFRFEPCMDSEEDNQKLRKAFSHAFGDQPKELPIILPRENLIDFWDMYYEIYGKQLGLVHRCDGVDMLLQYNRETKKLVRNPGPCQIEHHKNGSFKDATARLNFFLVPLLEAGFVGVVTFTCKSAYEIRQIQSAFDNLAPFTNGSYMGIPMKLYRVDREIEYTDDAGVGHSAKKSLVQLAPDSEWFTKAMNQKRIASGNSSLHLTDVIEEVDPEIEEHIATESFEGEVEELILDEDLSFGDEDVDIEGQWF